MKFLKNKGFTLAEMLIVMAVVVVLAAATVPAITGQTEAAKQSNDLAALANAYTQAYTEAAMAKEGGATAAIVTEPVTVVFQQAKGDFGKIPNAKLGNVSLSTLSIAGASGSKKVTFTFDKDTLAVTDIALA